MKQYLKKNGLKLGIIVLVVALIAGVGTYFLKGNAGLIQNISGAVKTPVQRIVSSLSGWLEGVYGYVYEYDELKAENERLRTLLGFAKKHSDMTLESAKIVSWTSSNWAHSFTISKGSNAGIEVGDCVITEYGVLVGQVTELGSNWAVVSTVIDINTDIGAFVSNNGSSGLVVGDFALMQDGYAKLTYLADGAQIFAGDEVVTSGSGGAFPQGLVIGTVEEVQAEAGGQIEYGLVRPGCDLDSLVQVFIVKDFEVVE